MNGPNGYPVRRHPEAGEVCDGEECVQLQSNGLSAKHDRRHMSTPHVHRGRNVAILCLVSALAWILAPVLAWYLTTSACSEKTARLETSAKDQTFSDRDLIVRLNETTTPEHYSLTIRAFLDDDQREFTFDGNCSIEFVSNVDQREISLHLKNLTIRQIRLRPLDEVKAEAIPIVARVYESAQLLRISVNDTTTLKKANKYKLFIAYEGLISPDALEGGFFATRQSTSTSGDQVSTLVAATQFQWFNARRAFPCFDEPSFKATFALTLIHREHYLALSNMPTQEERPLRGENGWVLRKFLRTPVMSTYLLAWTLIAKDTDACVFNVTAPASTKVTVYVPGPCVKDQPLYKLARYVADDVVEALDYFSNYFAHPFPLLKLDILLLQHYPYSGMENWGLIVLNCSEFEQSGQARDFLQYKQLIFHEVAHQWLGNLVTCRWWTDVWIQESLSEFLSFDALSTELKRKKRSQSLASFELKTELLKRSQFILRQQISTRLPPLTLPIVRYSQLNIGLFTRVQYGKGTVVMWLLQSAIGADQLQRILQHLIRTHAFKTVGSDDFYRAVQEVQTEAGTWSISWTELLKPYVEDVAVPVLSVKGNRVMLSTYTNMLNDYSSSSESKRSYDLQLQDDLFVSEKTTLSAEDISSTIIDSLTDTTTAFYTFLNFGDDEDTWLQLMTNVSSSDTALEFLASNLFAVSQIGELPYSLSLSVARKLLRQSATYSGLRYTLWQEIETVDSLLAHTDLYDRWHRSFIRPLIDSLVEVLSLAQFQSITGEQADYAMLSYLCVKLGERRCVEQAAQLIRHSFSAGYLRLSNLYSRASREFSHLILCTVFQHDLALSNELEQSLTLINYVAREGSSTYAQFLQTLFACDRNTDFLRAKLRDLSASSGEQVEPAVLRQLEVQLEENVVKKTVLATPFRQELKSCDALEPLVELLVSAARVFGPSVGSSSVLAPVVFEANEALVRKACAPTAHFTGRDVLNVDYLCFKQFWLRQHYVEMARWLKAPLAM